MSSKSEIEKIYGVPYTEEDLNQIRSGGGREGKFLSDAHHYSYYIQMAKVKQLGVGSVLEIGPGDPIVSVYLKSLGVDYSIMDIFEISNPEILSKLEDFDPAGCIEKYDLVCAYQMLEHSPYEFFADNVKKMRVMSKKYVFISLPYSCAGFKISLDIIMGQNRRWKKNMSFYLPGNRRNRRYSQNFTKDFPWAVHYWEIGRKGFPLKRILHDIESAGLNIVEKFHSENPYHYFILAEK